jgi:hypothetical protein
MMLIKFVALTLLTGLVANASADSLYRWVDKDGRVHYSDQPPQQGVKRLEEKRPGSANSVETSGPSYATKRAQKDFPVTLYVSPDCGAPCKSAQQFLAARGIPYAEVAVEGEEAVNQFTGVFGGKDVFVPAVTVGTQKIKGFEGGSWNGLLDQAGYPKSAGAKPAGDVGATTKAP